MKELNWTEMTATALVAILCGLGGYTFYYAKGSSYLSNDPRACVNCHVMREHYDGWQKSSHHAFASCNDCHTPHRLLPKYWVKMKNGYRHSLRFTLQDFDEPIRIKPDNLAVLEANCVNCHRALTRGIRGHPPVPGDPLGCVRCHSDVGHGPRA